MGGEFRFVQSVWCDADPLGIARGQADLGCDEELYFLWSPTHGSTVASPSMRVIIDDREDGDRGARVGGSLLSVDFNLGCVSVNLRYRGEFPLARGSDSMRPRLAATLPMEPSAAVGERQRRSFMMLADRLLWPMLLRVSLLNAPKMFATSLSYGGQAEFGDDYLVSQN